MLRCCTCGISRCSFLHFFPFPAGLGEHPGADVSANTFRTWARRGAGRDQLWLEQSRAILLLYLLGFLCHFLLPRSWQGLDSLFWALYCGHLLYRRQLQEPQPHRCDVCSPSNAHRGQGDWMIRIWAVLGFTINAVLQSMQLTGLYNGLRLKFRRNQPL